MPLQIADKTSSPTGEEVRSLMRDWAADPVWDLEDTPGFEAYRDELREFAERTRAEGERVYRAELAAYARSIRIPANLPLAEYVRGLERRVARLEERLDGGG
jgi:hypothetical protein